MRRFTVLLLLAVALRPLAAQNVQPSSNAERILNDQYTRSHDYDLVHQRIELSNFDWDSLAFDGRVVTTVVARRPGLDSLVLDADSLLDIRTVTTLPARGRRSLGLGSAHRGDTLVVRFSRPVPFGDTTRFVITYHGRVDNGRGLTFIKAEPGRAHRPQQIWSQGEDFDNHRWFPTYDFPNDKLTWELAATLPAAYTLVSNGRLVSDVTHGDSHTTTWAEDHPASSYLVSMVIAPLARIRDKWRTLPVDYYVYRADSALARPLFSVTPDMIDTYSRLTGVDYAWQKYAQTTVADFFGGMENVSATTLVDWLPDARAYQDRPWYRHILIPHELAHQWFGDLVTTENWANMWLNEGFAEFMPGQYWSARHGRAAEDDYYLDEYTQYLRIDARRRMPLASLGSNNIYPKGALVLEMLKKYLGPERFWASVHRYLTRHAYGNAVSDDLRQAVLDATGEDLDWFWSQWVYRAGLPELVVTDQYDSVAHRLTLTVRQTQVDTATADSTGLRFTVPRAFRMPLAVRVATPRGVVIHRVVVTDTVEAIAVDSVPAAPTYVIFDDGNAVLKQLRYDQPTTRLAAQLTRDPDLWNRSWVIDQLTARPTDTLAAHALADAATGADYFLTRAQAAAALAAFAARAALPPLERALRDTSSQVRESAARSLGQLADSTGAALALARAAWEHDSSYEVRAAALGSAARLGAADRRELIRTGLRTPSYRDAIRNAALGAAVLAGDSTLVSDVDATVADAEFASYVLAAMAVRPTPASAPADARLMAHLDDERGWVRRWTLAAVKNGMPPAEALRRLEAATPRLRHADARQAAEKAIADLEKKSAHAGAEE